MAIIYTRQEIEHMINVIDGKLYWVTPWIERDSLYSQRKGLVRQLQLLDEIENDNRPTKIYIRN